MQWFESLKEKKNVRRNLQNPIRFIVRDEYLCKGVTEHEGMV